MTIQFVVIIQFYTLIAVTNLTEATGKLRNNAKCKIDILTLKFIQSGG